MSRANLNSGRVQQKLRTREALLGAAAELLEQGHEPSIDEVAETAGVSRATAYRYFSDPHTLLLEVGLDRDLSPTDALFDELPPDDPAAAAVRVARYFIDHGAQNETRFRLFLSAALAEGARSGGRTSIRGARRVPLLERALAPLRERLGGGYEQLLHALTAIAGVDAYLTLRDVAGLPPDEARTVLLTTVRDLVEGALQRTPGRD